MVVSFRRILFFLILHVDFNPINESTSYCLNGLVDVECIEHCMLKSWLWCMAFFELPNPFLEIIYIYLVKWKDLQYVKDSSSYHLHFIDVQNILGDVTTIKLTILHQVSIDIHPNLHHGFLTFGNLIQFSKHEGYHFPPSSLSHSWPNVVCMLFKTIHLGI